MCCNGGMKCKNLEIDIQGLETDVLLMGSRYRRKKREDMKTTHN